MWLLWNDVDVECCLVSLGKEGGERFESFAITLAHTAAYIFSVIIFSRCQHVCPILHDSKSNLKPLLATVTVKYIQL